MEGTIGRWQWQLSTIKHYTETKLGKIIEVDGILFGWFMPYVNGDSRQVQSGG